MKYIILFFLLGCAQPATKFKYMDRVKIIKGFYSGQTGSVKWNRCGIWLRNYSNKEYEVRLDGAFEYCVDEDSLELIGE